MFSTKIKNIFLLILFLFVSIAYNKPVVDNSINALVYLKRFGYDIPRCDNPNSACSTTEPTFESMLKDFQKQFHLPVTGKLDDATKQLMNQPRCGLPDRSQLVVSAKDISSGNKWDKRQITWSFRHNDATYSYWLNQAFQKWREIIPQFTFREVCSTCNADIFISFQPINHRHDRTGSQEEFGQNVLAHAYFPKDGTTHFNREVKWTHSFQQTNTLINFYLVAVHELGHALGYNYKGQSHNVDDSKSIMFPSYSNLGKDNLFRESDRAAMRSVYPDAGGSNINWNGNDWAFACDFSKNDLKNQQTPADKCGPTCVSTQGCTHFTWTTYNGGTCWMKSGSVTKNNAFSTGDQSMVCGVVNRK